MSLVTSQLIDKLITEIPLVPGFTAKRRLPNPYALESNTIQQLSSGWGLLIGSSSIALATTKQSSTDLAFTVSLTRAITGSEEKPSAIDREVKLMQTDLHELILHISSNQTIAWPDGVWDVGAVSTDGIEYFNNDSFRMISASVNFLARIQEDLD